MIGKDVTNRVMKQLDHIHRVVYLKQPLTDSQKVFMFEHSWPPKCGCGEKLDSTPNGVADYFCPNCYRMYNINVVSGKIEESIEINLNLRRSYE